MSRKGGVALQDDVPWRPSSAPKPIPKIHHSPILRLPQNPQTDYGLYVMKQKDPIGSGLAKEAILEAAGPDCIVPGLTRPIRLIGLQVWPIEIPIIEIDFKFLEPVGRELTRVGKFLDSAMALMDKAFIDR